MSNQLTSATAFSPSLEAIKLAAQMYNAAREGNKQVIETAILEGMPPNLTNEKGDTLVSSRLVGMPPGSRGPGVRGPPPCVCTNQRGRHSSCSPHITATQT